MFSPSLVFIQAGMQYAGCYVADSDPLAQDRVLGSEVFPLTIYWSIASLVATGMESIAAVRGPWIRVFSPASC